MLTCNGFIIVTFKWINKNFKNFSVLTSNIANTDSYPNKQALWDFLRVLKGPKTKNFENLSYREYLRKQ